MKIARALFGVLVVAAVGNGGPALGQATLQDDFSNGVLDWTSWCPCQINMVAAPVVFSADEDQPGDYFARITVDEASLGGNKCRYKPPASECRPPFGLVAYGLPSGERLIDPEPDLPEPLGPSLVRLHNEPLRSRRSGNNPNRPKNPYCTPDVLRRAVAAGEEGTCIQRQELRLQKTLRHDARVPTAYALRFRMPATIEDRTHSVRWVTAQWKHAPVSVHYCREFDCERAWGPSPFLAQRFDDGVLHVTIQDEHCRCIVASAPLPDGSNRAWADGRAQYCRSTHPRTEGEACIADLQVEYGVDPVLSTALGDWVVMRYRVQAGRAKDAVIEVYEGDSFIVRVTGKIGYEPRRGEATRTKFKVGNYRDYMPFVHDMELDWLTMQPVAAQGFYRLPDGGARLPGAVTE